ncbi:hypothetical protein GGQ86_000960 [Xanthobacter flavus]|uniref:Glycosyltransferase 61 catalytic domain-containing protein n=1 Tax=Xanthobacter flavus TaxID=281 RepID=A0A9W6FJ17_XANFL|nr:glycosyltransferase family 61 protein [Xanthobacter flavus]MDR6332513.1 hypothetical protein [Xanthobacter flavus]GLI21735.1 hypothetical protein XFLAVUS301_14090 [Xanthobacter flavus]
MLNPHLIAQLRRAVAENPEVSMLGNLSLDRVQISMPSAPSLPSVMVEPAWHGGMTGPREIFGRPVDDSCLSGVGALGVSVPEKSIYTVENARVVGFDSILGPTGELFAPSPTTKKNIDSLLQKNETDHQGYLIQRSDESFYVYYAARPHDKHFNLDAVYFPNLEPGNYGSFIFRQLPQILSVPDIDRFQAIIVPDRTPWTSAALKMMGFENTPVFSLREVSGDTFRSISLFSDFDAEGTLTPATMGRMRRLATPEGRACTEPSKRHIYVSRLLSSLARPDYRPLKNEMDIEAFFSERGFEIVYPETLTFSEQIHLFHGASKIVGPSGSGMLNAVFSEPGTKIVDMESFHVCVRQHAKIYSSSEKAYSFLFGELEKGDRHSMIVSPWTAPMHLVREAYDWIMD